MNSSATLGFVIQSKVFGLHGELARWSQMKSCGSKSAVTRYLREQILPLGQQDNYRIEVLNRSSDGATSRHYLNVNRWFESRQLPFTKHRETENKCR